MSKPYFHTSIVKIAAGSDYNLSDEDLGTLVETKVKAGAVDAGVGDTYFRVLVRRSQIEVATAGEGTHTDAVLAGVDRAHKGMMAIVNDRVITPDIAPKDSDSSETKAEKRAERQRRTGFARSSKSALVRWIKAGGDLMGLNPADATKSGCERTAVETEKAAAEAAGENTPQAKVAKRLAGLITALNQIDDAAERAALVRQCTVAIAKGVPA